VADVERCGAVWTGFFSGEPLSIDGLLSSWAGRPFARIPGQGQWKESRLSEKNPPSGLFASLIELEP
jgi:hypothetical protein